jgi:hypothetical protein
MTTQPSTTDSTTSTALGECDPTKPVAFTRPSPVGPATWERSTEDGSCGQKGWFPDGGNTQKAKDRKSFYRWLSFDGALLWRWPPKLTLPSDDDEAPSAEERTGDVEDTATREITTHYLRRREYNVSKLPIFRHSDGAEPRPVPATTEEDATHRPSPNETAPHDDAPSPARGGSSGDGEGSLTDEQSVRLALYREAMSGWRQLTDVRFRLLSLLPAISIVAFIPLLLVTTNGNWAVSALAMLLALLGLGVTHGLHIYDQRNDILYGDLISRAKRIEAEWGVDTGVMLGRLSAPTNRVSHGRATFWVYRCVKVAWLLAALALGTAAAWTALEPGTSDDPRIVVEMSEPRAPGG